MSPVKEKGSHLYLLTQPSKAPPQSPGIKKRKKNSFSQHVEKKVKTVLTDENQKADKR